MNKKTSKVLETLEVFRQQMITARGEKNEAVFMEYLARWSQCGQSRH